MKFKLSALTLEGEKFLYFCRLILNIYPLLNMCVLLICWRKYRSVAIFSLLASVTYEVY